MEHHKKVIYNKKKLFGSGKIPVNWNEPSGGRLSIVGDGTSL
jgi:hypothetical protein